MLVLVRKTEKVLIMSKIFLGRWGGGEGALLRKSEDGLRMRYNLILRHFCINKKQKKMYINYET